MSRQSRRSLSLAACVLVLALGAAHPAQAQFVTRSGNQLVSGGQNFYFTGLNIYNANSSGNCWYAMSSGSALDDALSAIGPGKKVMRAWFFQSLATQQGQRDWSAFDHTLAVAQAHGVKVVATLTNQWADCEPASGYKDEAWYQGGYTVPDPSGTVSYRDWVAEVVSRYASNPTILAWQLVNEAEVKPSLSSPTCSPQAATLLKAFAADVSDLVKSLDPNHLTSLGTIGGGQCGAANEDYYDVHDVATIDLCEYHDYGEPSAPMPGDQWNGLQVRVDQCNALDKPLFVGEMGIRPSDVGGTLAGRADAFDAKLQAQFAAGVVGVLAWAWSNLGSTPADFDIGPGDPALDVLTAPPVGYPRPAGASPLVVPLVPAYASCASPDRVHGPPLDSSSCSTPVKSSAQLTVGTPDANGAGARSNGSLRFTTLPGDAGTPADEADVRITFTLTDVRVDPSLIDYAGELQAQVTLQITDRLNGNTATEAGTLTEQPFSATVPCVATADPQAGGTCALTTTADAVVPGIVRERKRSVWGMGQVRVADGGPDGVVSTSAGNELFAVQGVFVP